jgi:hypothetical protein
MAAISGVGAGAGIFVLFYLALVVVSIVAWVRILSKAGYSGWWILIAIVPIVNLVMFLVFAFSTWPIEQQLSAARAQHPGGYGPPPGGWVPPASGYAPPPSAGYPPPMTGYPPPTPTGYPPPAAPYPSSPQQPPTPPASGMA